MTTVFNTWNNSASVPHEYAQSYYLGRGALAHKDWRAAETALRNVSDQLRDSNEWSLRWLCRLGLATLAWRAEDGAAALAHAREANALAERIAEPWPRIWSLWLLGHVYAGLHCRVEATACFSAVCELIDEHDEQQRSLGRLAAVAAMKCTYESWSPMPLAAWIFGLAHLSVRLAKRHGLPFEAIEGLECAPVLVPAQSDSTLNRRDERLRMLVPQLEPLRRRQVGDAAPQPPLVAEPLAVDDRAPDLRAYCLGRFEVWVGRNLVEQWIGSKGKTLLKLLLAAYPAMVPAPRLMSAMWDGVEEELARQRLHTAISDLRRSLRSAQPDAGGLIISQNGSYGLDPQAVIWIDTAGFERAQRAGLQYEQSGRPGEARSAYCEAVALYQGDFLAEDRYEDWPIEQRERLKSGYLALLARIAEGAFSEGDYAACIRWSRMTIESDAGRERAHRLLMHCYSRLGQRTEALRQYRQCVEALRRELDALPAPETEELYRRLQQGLEL
ncbi:MAG: hypothetical protein HC822_24655 [Oscillochloris sp.]|nr:hypothetical protein [Oscillochloris sp.]